MKCPLIRAHFPGELGATFDQASVCLKEECAWWDKVMGRCCIPVLQTEMAMVVNNLANVFDSLLRAKEQKEVK